MTDPDRDLIAALGALRPNAPSDDLMARIADDAMVEWALADARARAPSPSDLLMARVARDARTHCPKPRIDAATWGGLVAAGIAGLMIGIGAPDLPAPLTAATLSYDLIPSYDFELLVEE